MTITELYEFMKDKKIVKAKVGNVELELHPDALVPEMDPIEREKWEKDIEEQTKDVEKYDRIDPRFWSI